MLAERRGRVIAGSMASITGAALLLWPLSFVASSPAAEVWRSLAVFSVATWVFGFAFLAGGSLMLVATVRSAGSGVVLADEHEPNAPRPQPPRHLVVLGADWALSAAATTVIGVQVDLFGPWVVAAAVLDAPHPAIADTLA